MHFDDLSDTYEMFNLAADTHELDNVVHEVTLTLTLESTLTLNLTLPPDPVPNPNPEP